MASLTDIRRDLARRAHSLELITTGVRYSGTYQGTPSGADAARRIISSDLTSVDRAGTRNGVPASANDYDWIYVPSTGEQRRITQNGRTSLAVASDVMTGQTAAANSSSVGYLVMDRALSSALTANTTVERLGRFPVLYADRVPGYHWAINEALSVMHWPKQITIDGVSDQSRYNVATTMPWLKNTSQIIRVFRPTDDSSRGPDTMRGPVYLEPDGEKMYLHIPEAVNTGDNFTVQVKIPAFNWIKVASTWASSTVGLVNETDECLPESANVVLVAYAILARRMARTVAPGESARWEQEALLAEEVARPYLETQVEPDTPKRDWPWRAPRHPWGKSWRAQPGRVRHWP